ncbi:hypothetical protein [Aneurinibacillus sp. REN35]|uniref:hypothetical protein n=1 Tax=Aneurinibacillus sp. REN35 TaxID=3237286 RepID=UPI0035275E09
MASMPDLPNIYVVQGTADSCRSVSSLTPRAPHRKINETHILRLILFYLFMDTEGVDDSEGKRPPQQDTNKDFRVSSERLSRLAKGKKAALDASV